MYPSCLPLAPVNAPMLTLTEEKIMPSLLVRLATLCTGSPFAPTEHEGVEGRYSRGGEVGRMLNALLYREDGTWVGGSESLEAVLRQSWCIRR